MLLLLVAGLVAAAAWHRQQRRLEALEALVATLLDRPASSADAAAPPLPPVVAPRPAAARVILPAVPARIESKAPAPLPEPGSPPAGSTGLRFEQLVGGRLPIWVGGAALAVAGYFLVRLAIESGLLTPPVRVLLATLFGFVLLGAAEGAARLRQVADDPRVAQALAGAGIATLYAAAYLAGSHYALIGPIAAFVMMAAITAAALGWSLRRGPPVALMALVGGFATPLLAGAHGQAILPLIAYLGLLSIGLFGLAVARGWLWLALTAAAGSLVWSGLLIATTAHADALAAGGFALLLAIGATLAVAASGGGGRTLLRTLPLVVGATELALLVASTGFGAGAWALYLLLSAAAIVLAWRDARLTPAVAAALALSAVAFAGTAAGGPLPVALAAAAGIGLLFGGAGHALARRPGDGPWWSAIGAAGLVAPYAALATARAALLPDIGWSALALLLALPPLHLAWRAGTEARAAPPFDVALQVGAGTAAAFLAVALAISSPPLLLPSALLAAAIALVGGGRRIGDAGLLRLARGTAAAALAGVLVASGPTLAAILATLGGERVPLRLLPPPFDAVRATLLPAPLLAYVGWRAAAAADPWRRLLWGGACLALAAGFYVLWKQLFAIHDVAGFVTYGFTERALLTQGIFAAGWSARRAGWATPARVLTGVAVGRMLWLDLAVFDPAFVEQAVGAWPVANLVALHFAAAALWIDRAWRAEPPGRGRTLALAALVAVAVGGMLLVVRQAFHGTLLTGGPLTRAEFYGYSAGGVLLAVALFGRGAWARDRQMRIAGLGLLTMMVLKAFLVDAAALQGLLRIASFVGLGVTLIAIGWAYGRLFGRGVAPPVAG